MGVEDVDVVCVGGGLGGLAAAATATSLGLRCAVVEAASHLGGEGAYGGGLLWAPLEPGDRLEDADRYLAHVQGERAGDDALRRSVLDAAVDALRHAQTLGIPFEVVPDNPDVFHPGAPGSRASGRMWEVAIPGAHLGALRPLLSPSPHYRVGLRHRELYGGRVDEVSLRELWARREAEDMLTFGPGLVAGYLRAAAVDGDATLHVAERVTRLTGDFDHVSGVRTDRGREIRARRGVVLATGGYGWAPYAADLEGLPDFVEAGPPTIRGDHLSLAAPFGAELARGGGPQFSMGARVRSDEVHPGTDSPMFRQLFDAMGLPHTIVVNRHGARFGDESYYVGINTALSRWSAEEKRWENVPCWLVVDEQFRSHYSLGSVPAGARYPDTVISAPDLRTLAERAGIDPEGLTRTVSQFNTAADNGEDPEFGRGSKPFVRRRYGDPIHVPNPNLGPVAEPPFHALRLRLLGTGMCTFGLRTDQQARVLRRTGEPVPGLYATGNAAATTEFRGYITGYANTRNVAMGHRAIIDLSQEG